MQSQLRIGLTYLIETIRDGEVVAVERVHNLMPNEGIAHMLAATFKGAAQVTTWYLGLYEGNYTPNANDTAATFTAAATECTTYSEATRPAWVEGAATTTIDNAASKAEFTSTADKTVYGGFLSSNPTKGAASGVLGSAVKFNSPKFFGTGTVLRVTAGFTFASA
jgi:hypothetical protein